MFLSIIAIEAVILVPSYWSQEARLLADLGEHARIVGGLIAGRIADRPDSDVASTAARRMLGHSDFKGVVIFSPDGARLAEEGEPVRIVASEGGGMSSAPVSTSGGPRYEVIWPAGTMLPNIGIAVSLDRSSVVSNLQLFVLRMGGLVTLIAAFVTLTTMLVLGHLLIFPMLQLRERLVVGADDSMELEVPVANQTDEFGEIIRKFNDVVAELYEVKRGLEERVEQRTADLAQSEQRLRAIVDNSPSLIFLKDTQSRILMINKAYEKRYGIAEETARGRDARDWMGKENAELLMAHDRKVISRGGPVETEFRHVRADGSSAITQSVRFPVRDPEGNIIGVGGIGTDITERKHAEEALRMAKLEAEAAATQAREASKAKSNFLAIMSHELRSPMNGVLGMADLISKSDLTAEQREFVELLQESGNSLMLLLNDILDLSKIEAGRVEIEKRDISLGELLESTRKLWTHLAEDKGLAFNIVNTVTEGDCIRSDRNRLRQVINNLVGNAIKFTAEGHVEVHVSEKSPADDQVELHFEVRDTGIGISDEQKDLIFQPFTQADSSTTRKYGGTGLGLAICKNLIELLGGEMEVLSTPGEGSVFRFTITVDRGEAKIQSRRPTPDLPSLPAVGQDHSALRLLVVEDNDINQSVISWMLAPLKCQYDIVGNGLEAVAAVARSTYDLVLMDVEMPEMNGLDATEQIRTLGGAKCNIPIIAMTANAMQGDRQKYLDAGMNDYVAKPIDHRELLAAIARVTDVAIPEVDDETGLAQSDGEDPGQPSNEEVAEKIDELMNGLDDLLDGTGR